jgi:hypothetical protein
MLGTNLRDFPSRTGILDPGCVLLAEKFLCPIRWDPLNGCGLVRLGGVVRARLAKERQSHDAFLNVRVHTGKWTDPNVHAGLFEYLAAYPLWRRFTYLQDATWWFPTTEVTSPHY